MVRILVPIAAVLAACTPSPEEAAMNTPSLAQDAASTGPPGARTEPQTPQTARVAEQAAAVGPILEPAPVTDNPLPAPAPADSPAEAEGRRTLSTAFVRVGPGGHLAIELHSGRVLTLRDVTLGPKDFCGALVLGGKAGGRYCGSYAEVAAARPGGGTAPGGPSVTGSD